mgnify:CR=1 FL=1
MDVALNDAQPVASKPFPVNPAANSSKMAIGQERDATNHPGKESFDGDLDELSWTGRASVEGGELELDGVAAPFEQRLDPLGGGSE